MLFLNEIGRSIDAKSLPFITLDCPAKYTIGRKHSNLRVFCPGAAFAETVNSFSELKPFTFCTVQTAGRIYITGYFKLFILQVQVMDASRTGHPRQGYSY
jgi:hypothetical protein